MEVTRCGGSPNVKSKALGISMSQLLDILNKADELVSVKIIMYLWDGKYNSLLQHVLQPLRSLTKMKNEIELCFYEVRPGEGRLQWWEKCYKFKADDIDEDRFFASLVHTYPLDE